MFITDDKLPDDVVRRQYAETKHALCCLNCGFEYGFDPTLSVSHCGFFWSMSAGLRRAECAAATTGGVLRSSALRRRVLTLQRLENGSTRRLQIEDQWDNDASRQ
jgi:hypothetical protein